MESLYSSLIVFSGVTITLLGAFLLASERQLKNRQRELDEFKRHQGAKPIQSPTAGEHSEAPLAAELVAENVALVKEVSSLSNQLEDKQRRLDEYRNQQHRLLSVQSDNQQLRETLDSLRTQLEKTDEQSTRRIQEVEDHRATLQANVTALRQQLAEKEAVADSLQSEAQQTAKIQGDNQALCVENQRLQEEVAKLQAQLQTNDERLNVTSAQYNAIVEQRAQLQSEFTESKDQAERLAAKNTGLLEELRQLSEKLIASEKNFEELSRIQENQRLENQSVLETKDRLQCEIAEVHSQLTTTQSQLDAYVERNEKLQTENNELKQELEQRKASIDKLQSAERRHAEIQSESQELRMQNQVLQQELEKHRTQLNASEVRLQQSVDQNQELSDRCAHLEAEVADWKQRREESQAKIRELEAVQQQLANVESREMIYREQRQKLETRIVDLERELAEAKNQQGSQETERLCQELGDENRRLRAEVSEWQRRLVGGEENQKQLSILRQQLDDLRIEHARLIDEKRQAHDEVVANSEPVRDVLRVPSESGETPLLQSITDNIAELSLNSVGSDETRGDQTFHESRGSAASTHAAKDVKVVPLGRTTATQKWSPRAVPVVVVLIASAVFVGLLGTQFSTSTEPGVAPEPSANEFAADEDPKPQTKAAPHLRGTFETIRSAQVYGGPSENAALIANIGPGMKLNVINSSDGWLEVRSKHGRPPGFIRQDAAVRIGQN
jgi:regulator of replication initiation timing